MKNVSAKRYGSLALALAAFAVAGTAPVSPSLQALGVPAFGKEWYAVRAVAVDQRQRLWCLRSVPATIRRPVRRYSTAPAFTQYSGSWNASIRITMSSRDPTPPPPPLPPSLGVGSSAPARYYS